jgi:5'-phosphate synthase pdxT subunit
MRVGVVSLQGDFEKHLEALRNAGRSDVEGIEVRTPEELATVERLIIPGGESTTVGMLMERFGLGQAIQDCAAAGMPIWGTCMGMIMMAHGIEGRPDQYSLRLLDIDVRRNAFGAQVHSFEDSVAVKGMDQPVLGVFIRAPIVSRLGEGIEVLATYEDQIVAVRKNRLLGTSFHPELTSDTRMHAWFLDI